MGFFFVQQALQQAKRQPKGVRQAAANKQNIAILNRLGCSACPLNKADVHTPKMQPTLAEHTLVYFLAESPGQHEDQTSGRPLTGPSGKLLRQCIPDEQKDYCSYDNVVRDRPPGNRTPTWNEREACRQYVTSSIEQAKPRLIVGLGTVPLEWMLGSTDQQGMRGRVFAVKVGNHSCWFLPTYHPAYLLYEAKRRKISDPMKSMIGHAFRMDLRRAFALLAELPQAKVDTEAEAKAGVQCFSGPDDEPLRGLLTKAAKAPIKAIDIETSALRPYSANAQLLTCAISFDNTHFSFAIDHPKANWSSAKKHWLKTTLKILLADDTIKVAHNAPFELEWFIQTLGRQVAKHGVWHCTMMQAHFLDERRGKQYGEGNDRGRAAYQSLGFLCKQYFGLDYKRLFKLNKKDMASSDLNETLLYNAVDTKYTLRLYKHQKSLLKGQGLWDAYLEALPRQVTVALMQHIGIDVSQKTLKKVQATLGSEIDELHAEIQATKEVKRFKREKGDFNPLSSDDLLVVFKDYIQSEQVTGQQDKTKVFDFDVASKTKKKHVNGGGSGYSLDKHVLNTIDHPLAEMILSLRNRTKLKSTYIDPFEFGQGQVIFPNGKIHTSFNTTFAETGRLSSDGPNLQNFPQRTDSWVRQCIVPPENHVLLAFDYGQLEGCAAAMCSKDKVMVQAMWDDYDFHAEWRDRIYKRYPRWVGSDDMTDKKVLKKYRSIAKNKMVFPAMFGAANNSIAAYLNIPDDMVDDVMTEFWQTFHGLKRWQDRLMRDYYDNGYVASPTGRWHRAPLRRNQAINFPIQSVACDLVCEAMNKISEYAITSGEWHYHPVLNVHDDITFCIPDDPKIIDEAIDTIVEVMLHPPYDFINVPMSVECSKGYNWFEMNEVGKFWSNK